MSLLDALLLDAQRINVWVAFRTDGQKGCGTQADPYNGSNAGLFDDIMNEIPAAAQAVQQCQARLPADAEHPAKTEIETEISELEKRLVQLKESIGVNS